MTQAAPFLAGLTRSVKPHESPGNGAGKLPTTLELVTSC